MLHWYNITLFYEGCLFEIGNITAIGWVWLLWFHWCIHPLSSSLDPSLSSVWTGTCWWRLLRSNWQWRSGLWLPTLPEMKCLLPRTGSKWSQLSTLGNWEWKWYRLNNPTISHYLLESDSLISPTLFSSYCHFTKAMNNWESFHRSPDSKWNTFWLPTCSAGIGYGYLTFGWWIGETLKEPVIQVHAVSIFQRMAIEGKTGSYGSVEESKRSTGCSE